MDELKLQISRLHSDAARCDRLCAGTYNSSVTAQLLSFATEYRRHALQLERGRKAA